MPVDPLVQRLAFLREIDGLKSVVRQTPILDRSRKENSAEHSWHLAMYALLLHDLADRPAGAPPAGGRRPPPAIPSLDQPVGRRSPAPPPEFIIRRRGK